MTDPDLGCGCCARVRAAYRGVLGVRLRQARQARGLSVATAASRVGMAARELARWEQGQRRVLPPRLARLCGLYGLGLREFLLQVAAAAHAAGGAGASTVPVSPDQALVLALLLLCGLVPEQVGQHCQAHHGSTAGEAPPGLLSGPLGEVLRYVREDNQIRILGAELLRREYEAGASIHALSQHHQLAFGTVRTLLLEAGTVLRSPGGAHPRADAPQQDAESALALEP